MRGRLVLLLSLVCAFGACDLAPVDPLDPRVNVTALLLGDDAVGRNTQLSMPGLLHAAIRKVYTEQGAIAARAMIGELRRLHDQAQTALANGDREASVARLRAVRAEEIRIVLRVFGDRLASRVVDDVTADAAQLAAVVGELESAGQSLTRARELLTSIDALLVQSGTYMELGNAAAALDAAARAASATDGLRQLLVDLARVPTVDVLYDAALARLRAATPNAVLPTRRHDALQQAAHDAVRSGDHERAHTSLRAARAERIRLVLEVLGADVVDRMLQDVKKAHDEAGTGLARARTAGRDIYKLERMLETTRDLHGRATQALAGRDAATALDLGSHAATLVNAIRIALSAN